MWYMDSSISRGRSVRCGEAIREEFAVYAFFIGSTHEDKFGTFFFPGVVDGLEFVCQHLEFPGGKTVGAEEVFYGAGFTGLLKESVKATEEGQASVFGYYVNDPERYGVAEFDKDGN